MHSIFHLLLLKSTKQNHQLIHFTDIFAHLVCIGSFFHSNCSVECFVVFQIEDGDIYASINLRDGMVSFHHNPEKYNNPKMLKKLDSEVWLQSVCGDSCLYYRTLCCIKKSVNY